MRKVKEVKPMPRKEKTGVTRKYATVYDSCFTIIFVLLLFQSNVNLQKTTSSKKVDRVSPTKSPVEDPSKSMSMMIIMSL